MAKIKTSSKRTSSRKNLRKKTGAAVKLKPFSPTQELTENFQLIFSSLVEALADGDKETFQEILEAYVKARNILEVSRETNLSRSLIYEAIDKKRNPRLGTICKIMAAFNKAS